MPAKKISSHLIAKQIKTAKLQNHAVLKPKIKKDITPSSKNKKIAKPEKPQSPDNVFSTCVKLGFEVKVQGGKSTSSAQIQHKIKKDDAKGNHVRN